ncbi:hypothetical protein BH23ACT3_BH23ACT3_01870 [soil metagenome]
MEIRRHLPGAVMTVGAVVTVWGSFQPWLASGSAQRSSYQLLGLVDRLGYAASGPMGWAVSSWPVMPLLVVTATVAIWWGRVRTAALLGAVGALHAAAVSVGIRRAPGDGLVRTLSGASITLAGSAVILVGVAASLALARRPTPARAADA